MYGTKKRPALLIQLVILDLWIEIWKQTVDFTVMELTTTNKGARILNLWTTSLSFVIILHCKCQLNPGSLTVLPKPNGAYMYGALQLLDLTHFHVMIL